MIKKNGGMIIKAINIKWDVVDSAEDMAESEIKEILGTLPTEVEIPKEIDFEDVSDWLSDTYGFCHFGFDIAD